MKTTQRHYTLAAFAVIGLITLLACSLFGAAPSGEEPSPTVSAPTQPPPAPTEVSQPSPTEAATAEVPPTEVSASEEQPGPAGSLEILTSELTIDGVASTADESFGRIIQVDVTNPQDHEVEVAVPCGLIFEPPPDSGQQRLMVIQDASAVLAPGESVSLTPFVVCIDSDQSLPEAGGAYNIGAFTDGDLLKFARCVCEQEIAEDDFDAVALQFAMWMVSDGESFEDFLGSMEEAGGALGSFSEGEIGEMLSGLADFLQTPIESWLERCDLQPPGE